MISITSDALTRVQNKETLFAFLRDELGWPLDPKDTFTYDETLLNGTVLKVKVSRLLPFGASDPFLLLLAEWETPLHRSELREILRAVRARIREEGAYGSRKLDEIVFVCPALDYHSVWFAHFEERDGRQPKLEAFGWEGDRVNATRTLREVNLPALAMPPLNLLDEPDWASGYHRWLSAWDVESVTRAFFKDYRQVFDGVRGSLPVEFEGDRTLWTQRLFNRLLFIHFLSQKREGWLRFGGRKDYLQALWEDYNTQGGSNVNFYRTRLRPLFFTGLNNKQVQTEKNETLHILIGDVPYLNGGLFEKAADDDAVETVPDGALALVMALFGQYRFTITESTPDDVEVAVDPEMLGKVFEELVTGRHESGSYYTPRPVVAFMCREALKGYLGGGTAIAALVDGRSVDTLNRRDAADLLHRLGEVRVVDPACGSGAYLLGMLHELYELAGLLELRADPLSARDQYKRKLGIIQNALYGVDKDEFAVNVARLRLWLSLAVEHTGAVPEPLPNLNYKVEVGDSLASPMMPNNFTTDLIRLGQIDKYKADKDLFGGSEFEGDRKQLDKDIQALKTEIAAWLHQNDKKNTANAADNSASIFEWQVEFAEVFKAAPPSPGGFDIVLANPPYVRQELIKDQKPRLKAAFPEVYTGTADLYCYFYARAVQLLRPGGMLAFISPNKWFRAGYGANLRKYLAATCRVASITDFGELPVFQAAATFPMIFVAQRTAPLSAPAPPLLGAGGTSAPGATFTQVKSLAAPYPDVLALLRRDGQVLPADAIRGADWTLTDAVSSDRLRKMEKAGIPLGEYVNKQLYRGLVTGFNAAFYIDDAKKSELIIANSLSAEIIKPLLVGDNVRRWRTEQKKWVIATNVGIEIERYPAIFAYLSGFQQQLEDRWDKGKHWWELRSCVYYSAFEKSKIVYPDIGKEPRFTLDARGCYLDATATCIGSSDLYLLGLLNSPTVWSYIAEKCSVLGDAGAGGRIRLKTFYVERIPIPNASDAERAAIAALVQHCLDARGVGCEVWEAEIDSLVAALYGL